jgi:hypothetical protein
MNKQIEALKLVIDFLNREGFIEEHEIQNVIETCKEALAEAEKQEPVAYADYERGTCYLIGTPIPKDEIANPLYTHPAQPLSDDEINKLLSKFVECLGASHGIQENGIPEDNAVKFARAIEQTLKEKNHG